MNFANDNEVQFNSGGSCELTRCDSRLTCKTNTECRIECFSNCIVLVFRVRGSQPPEDANRIQISETRAPVRGIDTELKRIAMLSYQPYYEVKQPF